MFNPLNLAISAASNYVNFWENTSTIQRIGAHALTTVTVVTFRASIRTNPANIAYVHEVMAVIGLISHVFIAIMTGSRATKKLDLARVDHDPDIAHRFDRIDQQLTFLSDDVKKLGKNIGEK